VKPLLSRKIDFNAVGNNELIPATAGESLRLFRVFFVVAGAVSIRFRDGTEDLTGAISLAANGSFVLDTPREEQPWFSTSSGRALVLNTDAAVQVSGRVYYLTQKE